LLGGRIAKRNPPSLVYNGGGFALVGNECRNAIAGSVVTERLPASIFRRRHGNSTDWRLHINAETAVKLRERNR
jgi:hypothetical protein